MIEEEAEEDSMDQDTGRRLFELMTEMKESLESEIGAVHTELQDFRAEVRGRFDAQAARLDRHAALWQTGTRWSSRMDAWAEKIDANADATRRDISDMKERIRALEQRLPPPGNADAA